jgi:hypothetical protein
MVMLSSPTAGTLSGKSFSKDIVPPESSSSCVDNSLSVWISA